MTYNQHIDKAKLNASDAHFVGSQCLQSCLEVDMEKRNYTAQDILDVLIVAATQATSIEAVCRDMPQAPSPNTVRKVIEEALPEERRELEAKLNEVLVSKLPKKLLLRRLACAIDLSTTTAKTTKRCGAARLKTAPAAFTVTPACTC